ncbi:hypothetical protein [Arthrobacter sp. AFG20]|uniref:hypothetical protein n=1 Tax=Arthrobacter sp. AFG20 TaxID=1688671 RepID=UPI0015E0CBAA|nr:hypothetical protein [Arthrobacter sp. AFG20]
MTVLRTTPESEASGLTAKIYDDDVQSLGYVTTHTKSSALQDALLAPLETPRA